MDPAALNKMLEGRIKDLASVRRGSSKEDLDVRKQHVLKALGLHPFPPKTEINAQVTGVVQRDGYRIEKLRYESRPGLLVTAHLYLPEGEGPWPLIVSSHGSWKGKKAAPVVQARGVAFTLRGFATLIVDAPGRFGEADERAAMGDPTEVTLLMGAPWVGQYAWDLARGIDACAGRADIHAARIGVTGEGDGGIASLAAFVAEPRFACAAFICTAPSLEQGSLESIGQLGIPGLSLAGDFSDMLAIRAPAPAMLLAAANDDQTAVDDVAKTAEKLAKSTKNARFERFEGGRDYNRRMRESAAAFFDEHLRGQSPRAYLPELRPLTDGAQNPYPAGTVPEDDPELFVTNPDGRQTLTFQDVLRQNLAEPHPEPLHCEDRLAPWPKYGAMPRLDTAITLGLHDLPSVTVPKATPSIGLPYQLIDMRLAALAGLSIPEFLAQVLHIGLPGRPETWEAKALTGEGLTALIASVKTLVQSASPETVPTHLVAEGPVASLTAMFLKLYRPSLQIETSHKWTSWSDLLNTQIPQLIQPQARYLAWPF